MSGEVSKLPLGLLGFLGIKNGGAYPRSLGGQYAPTIDSLPLLAGVNFEELNPGNTAVAATGGNAGSFSTGFQVPQTEVWYVTLCSAGVTTGVGEAFFGYLALRRFPVSSPNVVHAISDTITVAASIVNQPLLFKYDSPLILGPGDEVCLFTITATGAPQTRGHLRFARFPI